MEVELEATVKPLAYKIKSVSRESPSQKSAHVLDTDLRSHWSSGTNTKEWILLELEVFAELKNLVDEVKTADLVSPLGLC